MSLRGNQIKLLYLVDTVQESSIPNNAHHIQSTYTEFMCAHFPSIPPNTKCQTKGGGGGGGSCTSFEQEGVQNRSTQLPIFSIHPVGINTPAKRTTLLNIRAIPGNRNFFPSTIKLQETRGSWTPDAASGCLTCNVR